MRPQNLAAEYSKIVQPVKKINTKTASMTWKKWAIKWDTTDDREEIEVSRSHVEKASRLAVQSSHVSCNLESLFAAPRDPYGGGRVNYDDPVQMDCNPSNHRDCFDSDDNFDRHDSFHEMMGLLRGVQYKLENVWRDLAREHERANRIYTDLLNQFTGSPIKFSPSKRRDSNHNEYPPLDPANLFVCNCFLEPVAHYFEVLDFNEVMQTDIEILRIKHQELIEKTTSLRWKIDNNQVHADELANMLDAENRKGKRR
ncbi:hypothetical protein BOTCAL_0073g00250 [Botryotinia calthae]|uniref:Uncharacterized protein n=1 Tax=Botryotinia calthae TaxID=38488 RepID=A0A4Y8D8N7_9HELO|nr:hypothetical protein BOTCAL_0073g00250 [Botryotinia calthae]